MTAAALIGGEITFARPGAAWGAGAATAIAIACALGALLGAPYKNRKTIVLYAAPLLLWAAAFFAILVAEGTFVRHLIAFVAAGLIGSYGANLALATSLPGRYESFSLSSIAQVVGLLTVFFISFDLFSLMVFIQIPVWIIPCALFGFTGLITFAALSLAEIPPHRMLPHLALVPAIAAETGLALTFLPFAPTVLAAISTFVVYAAGGLTREHARTATIGTRLLRRYAVVAVGALVIVMGTARWP